MYDHDQFVFEMNMNDANHLVLDLGEGIVCVTVLRLTQDVDVEHLGRLARTWGSYAVDRKLGALIGPPEEMTYSPAAKPDPQSDNSADSPDPLLMERAQADGWPADPALCTAFSNADGTLTMSGHRHLRQNLGCTQDRNQHRYWAADATTGSGPASPLQSSLVTDTADTDIESIIAAWNQYERYLGGDWAFAELTVTLHLWGKSLLDDTVLTEMDSTVWRDTTRTETLSLIPPLLADLEKRLPELSQNHTSPDEIVALRAHIRDLLENGISDIE